MEFADVLRVLGNEPAFETGLLLAGDVDPRDVRRQLSRWTAGGRIHQLRRGVYSLTAPYQKVKPHPFVLANRIVRASYVSRQSALAHYGLIPEHVPVVTSVTTQRPHRWDTALGSFDYRHVKTALFWGCRLTAVGVGQDAVLATAEKALLDLIHLQPGGDDPDYLRELRLQNLDRLDTAELVRLARRTDSPKLQRAAAVVVALAQTEAQEYREL